jgi:hypothetical protein
MNTSVETIDSFAETVRTIANGVAERCGLQQGCGVEEQGHFLLVNFAFRPPIRIPREWVTDYPMNITRLVEELVEARLCR